MIFANGEFLCAWMFEVVDWFKSKGPGYQTRINLILRKVMEEGKKRTG